MNEDVWYATLLERFPEGTPMTLDQFKWLTLESATMNEEGQCWPPYLTDFFAFHNRLTRMNLDGLVKRKNFRMDEPILPYLITESGLEYLKTTPRPTMGTLGKDLEQNKAEKASSDV